MQLINKILQHTSPETKVNFENTVSLNNNCVSLITKETVGKKVKEKIIKEFDIQELKDEYVNAGNKKKEIQDLFESWGVSL